MKNILLVVLMAFSINISTADTVKTLGLSDAQVAKLNVQAAQMALKVENAKENPVSSTLDKIGDIELTDENFEKFGKYGEQAAKIITGFAKEIGITVSQFLETKWGIVAAIMVAWHFYGGDISLIVFSMGLNLLFIPIWISFARSGLYQWAKARDRDGDVIYKKDNETPILKKQLVLTDLDGNVGGLLLTSMVVFIIIQLVILVNMG